jgi:hypothetical protein
MTGVMQKSDERLSSEDIVECTQISEQVQHDSALISNEGGSGDELCFDDHMAQQELGARSRHRQSLINLHYNINHELQQERESGGHGRLRGRNERCRRLEGGMLG